MHNQLLAMVTEIGEPKLGTVRRLMEDIQDRLQLQLGAEDVVEAEDVHHLIELLTDYLMTLIIQISPLIMHRYISICFSKGIDNKCFFFCLVFYT